MTDPSELVMESLLKDLRYGLRGMVRHPVITLTAVLSLGLGIGANTTLFTFLKTVFLDPLPVEEPSRLMTVFTTHEASVGMSPLSFPNFEDMVEGNEVFEGLVIYQTIPLNLSGDGPPEQVNGEIVSGEYFDVLGVNASVGRTFLPAQYAHLGTDPVAVISHSLWSRRFGADPDLIGETILLNAQAFTVIGVAPPGFRGTNLLQGPDLWVPMAMRDQLLTGILARFYKERRALLWNVVGRLRPGISQAAAQAAMDGLATNLEREYPTENEGRGLALIPLTEAAIAPDMRGHVVLGGGVLMAVVGLLLLIVCANVANLLLSRATARGKEISIRLAVGASGGRLFRQLMTENLLLSAVGALVGLAVAFWSRDVLWALRPPMLSQAGVEPKFDTGVLVFSLLLTLLSGLLFGLAPALRATRPDMVSALKDLPSGGRGHRLFHLRNLLVIAQVALTLIALVGAGLFLQGLRSAQRIDPGFVADGLVVMSFDLGAQGYDEDRGREFQRLLLEKVQGLSGVEHHALASNIPLTNVGGFQRSVQVEGKEPPPGPDGSYVVTNLVTPDYFATTGIELRAGVPFSEHHRQGTQPVAVINEAMARLFWPDEEPIGQRFQFFGEEEPVQIVGVVANSKNYTLGETPQSTVYLPALQRYHPAMTLFARTSGTPATLLGSLRREVQEMDRNLPLINIWQMSEVIAQNLWAPRIAARLLGLFGLLGLLLASIGIYGSMAYAVRQRGREFGIRSAMGARRIDLVTLVLRQGMTVVCCGLVLGLVGALALAHAVSGIIYGASTTDLMTFLLTPLILAVVALFALLFPARRAAKVNPVKMLRAET